MYTQCIHAHTGKANLSFHLPIILRDQLVKLSRQLWPRWELEGEEIPLSPRPKGEYLLHCCRVEREGCGVYLEGC